MIVVFSHPKGGVGKTTVCFNYCVYKQLKTKDFIVVDLDGQHSMSDLNKLREKNGLSTLNIKTFDKKNQLIDFLNNNQDKDIVIDSGGFDSDFNRFAVAFSDIVIVPVSDSPLEGMRLFHFSDTLKEISTEIKRKLDVYVLLNRLNHSYSDKTLMAIKKEFSYEPYKCLSTVIRDRADFQKSLTQIKAVFEVKMDTKASKEIISLYEEIRKILNK